MVRTAIHSRQQGDSLIDSTEQQRNGHLAEPPERTLERTLKPLLAPKLHLAIFISAKSGGTFALKWFLYQCDRLAEAHRYHNWPHRFREEVLYQESGYDVSQVLDPQTRIVKFVRNPYARAVSAYLHAARFPYEDEKLAKFLGRSLDPENRFSFREFTHYLDSIDLNRCNPHHRLQQHPAEIAGIFSPDHIVRLEDGDLAVKRVEGHLGLPHAPLDTLRRSPHHTTRCPENRCVADVRFNFSERNAVAPVDRAFYDPELIERVAQLYRRDLTAYGYSMQPPW